MNQVASALIEPWRKEFIELKAQFVPRVLPLDSSLVNGHATNGTFGVGSVGWFIDQLNIVD